MYININSVFNLQLKCNFPLKLTPSPLSLFTPWTTYS